MKMTPISEAIWQSKYRFENGASIREKGVSETWHRVAHAVATAESNPDRWEAAFYSVLADFLFLPGGRILAGAGTDKRVTLFNCFVAGPVLDSVDSILDSLKETAVTMQHGGGIGCDFSMLRPSGSPAQRSGSVASGPVSFMHIWDSLCGTLLATSSRRGAMMGTLRCDHPDIEIFVNAKRQRDALRNFNLSVLITDKFMQAVSADTEWHLLYPAQAVPGEPRSDNGARRHLPAKALWRQIIQAAHDTAEPGLLFIDNINRNNNLYYCENISATNPCGEIPLPPYGACNLGSINLTTLVREPFTRTGRLDQQQLRETVGVAVRFLDDVIDISRFPTEEQAGQARKTRRIGIGITGLADMLAMLGFYYDSDAAREFAQNTVGLMRDAAYEVSVELAREKGAFAALDKARYLEAPFIRRLPDELRCKIGRYGIRNSHLLAIAPAGTISLLAGNVSSGIEPIFALDATRDIRGRDLKIRRLKLRDFAYSRWLSTAGRSEDIPDCFVTAAELPASAHLAMQACLQPFVDNAISKTVNLAAESTVDDVADLYAEAYSLGLKGCTVFRPGIGRRDVLRTRDSGRGHSYA
jgi:ribonucleoside-diphosphate reductase alpha chain